MHLLSNTFPSLFSKNVCDMLWGPSMLPNPFYSLEEADSVDWDGTEKGSISSFLFFLPPSHQDRKGKVKSGRDSDKTKRELGEKSFKMCQTEALKIISSVA